MPRTMHRILPEKKTGMIRSRRFVTASTANLNSIGLWKYGMRGSLLDAAMP